MRFHIPVFRIPVSSHAIVTVEIPALGLGPQTTFMALRLIPPSKLHRQTLQCHRRHLVNLKVYYLVLPDFI